MEKFENLESNTINFAQLQHWVDFYAKNNGIKIEIDPQLNGPAAVPDNSTSSNLVIKVNPFIIKQILEKENIILSDEQVLQMLFHEIEHIKEDGTLKSNEKGKQIALKRQKRQQEHGVLSQSYHFLENSMRDIFVDTETVAPYNAPVLYEAMIKSYKERRFKETDYTNHPKHLQFCYAVLRETMVPGDICTIDPSIRRAINIFKNAGIIEKGSTGLLQDRLEEIREKIEPFYSTLLQKDIEEHQNNNQNQQNQNNNSDDQQKEQGDDQENTDNQQNSQSKNKEEKDGDTKKSENSSSESEGQQDKNSEANVPKNPFEDRYDKAKTTPHILEDALSEEEMEKLEKTLEEKVTEKLKPKTKEELEREMRAENILEKNADSKKLKETIKQLEDYDNFLEKLKNLTDPESGESIMDSIENIFTLIQSHRQKPKYRSTGPVDIEHGELLHGPSLSSGIADILSGNDNPEMFTTQERIIKENFFTGKFEVDIIADGSGSMDGEKNRQQKIAVLAIFEALKQLHDRLEENKSILAEPIEFNTQGRIFGTEEGTTTFKYQGSDFNDKERLESYRILDYCDGGTNDYDSLEAISNEIDELSDDEIKKIKSGKTKKIVICLSDGGSDSISKAQKQIKSLREKGVLVYGIGITKSGSPMINLYENEDKKTGFGSVCEKPEDLAITIKQLLEQHLKKL